MKICKYGSYRKKEELQEDEELQERREMKPGKEGTECPRSRDGYHSGSHYRNDGDNEYQMIYRCSICGHTEM